MKQRYSVVKVEGPPPDPDFHRPRKGPGWRIRDHSPGLLRKRDERGTAYGKSESGPSIICWFAKKRAAVAHCGELNARDSEPR